MTLYAEHLNDLHSSGLSDRTIETMQCYSVTSRDVLGLSDAIVYNTKSALIFPYFYHGKPNNFIRVKLFPTYINPAGAITKYWQAHGTKPHLYILPTIEPILDKPENEILLVEGEKKAAKAIEMGYNAIGLGGLWNWKEKNMLKAIDEFNSINWQKRTVTIVPDSDVWSTDYKWAKIAMYALAEELESRGANINFVCPENQHG